MAERKKQDTGLPAQRERRAKLTAEESLKRMEGFARRKGQFIASVRNGKERGMSS